jgi:hypothetical protein
MAQGDIEPAPTGPFGERGPETGPFGEGGRERVAEDTAQASYPRETTQHFSRWRQGEPQEAVQEGTAQRVPRIDRPRPGR